MPKQRLLWSKLLTGHIDASKLGTGPSDLKDGPVSDVGDMGQHKDVEVIAEFTYAL
jgi:hypothetical protein